MDKQIVMCGYNTMLLSNTKEQIVNARSNMDAYKIFKLRKSHQRKKFTSFMIPFI